MMKDKLSSGATTSYVLKHFDESAWQWEVVAVYSTDARAAEAKRIRNFHNDEIEEIELDPADGPEPERGYLYKARSSEGDSRGGVECLADDIEVRGLGHARGDEKLGWEEGAVKDFGFVTGIVARSEGEAKEMLRAFLKSDPDWQEVVMKRRCQR